MTVIDDFLDTLEGDKRQTISRMYDSVRQWVPDASEELSYGMPAFKWHGQGLIAIMPTRAGLSLYPFCAVERLGLDLSDYELTTGSIHFGVDRPIPETLLRQIVTARQQHIADQP